MLIARAPTILCPDLQTNIRCFIPEQLGVSRVLKYLYNQRCCGDKAGRRTQGALLEPRASCKISDARETAFRTNREVSKTSRGKKRRKLTWVLASSDNIVLATLIHLALSSQGYSDKGLTTRQIVTMERLTWRLFHYCDSNQS